MADQQFEKDLEQAARDTELQLKTREAEIQAAAARDSFVQTQIKKQGPLAELINKYIGQWNEKPKDRGMGYKGREGAGLVRDVFETTPAGAAGKFIDSLFDLPRVNPQAIAEQVGVLRHPMSAGADQTGRQAMGRNVKGLAAAGAGLLGNGAMGTGGKATFALLDFLNGVMADEGNWSPVTGAAAGSAMNALGAGPLQKVLGVTPKYMSDIRPPGANPVTFLLKELLNNGKTAKSYARMLWPSVSGGLTDLGAQAGSPDNEFHIPWVGMALGIPGGFGMWLGEHANNQANYGPTRTGRNMLSELEKRTGMPLDRGPDGNFSVGLRPGETAGMASTIEDVADRNIARETLQDALDPTKRGVRFDLAKAQEVFGKTLQRNLTSAYFDNPEFKSVVDAQIQRRIQAGMDPIEARTQAFQDTGKMVLQGFQSGGQFPKYLQDAVTGAATEAQDLVARRHSQAVGEARKNQQGYIDLLKESRLNAPETAGVFRELTSTSSPRRYVKFDLRKGTFQEVPQGTPGAQVIEDFAENARRLKPESIAGQRALQTGQVANNRLESETFFRKLQEPEFKKYVVDVATAADLPADPANFSKGQARAWNTFQHITDPQAFATKLFDSPDALSTFVEHFGDVPKVMEPARRQIVQEILDGTANFVGPKQGSGGRVTGTAFDKMVKMDPKAFDKVMGQAGSHKALLELAEASKMAQEVMAESHITVQAKDIVMLTLATMYSMGASAGSQPIAFGLAGAAKVMANVAARKVPWGEKIETGQIPVISKLIKKYWENPAAVTGRQSQLLARVITNVLNKPPKADVANDPVFKSRPMTDDSQQAPQQAPQMPVPAPLRGQ